MSKEAEVLLNGRSCMCHSQVKAGVALNPLPPYERKCKEGVTSFAAANDTAEEREIGTEELRR